MNQEKQNQKDNPPKQNTTDIYGAVCGHFATLQIGKTPGFASKGVGGSCV